MVLKRKKRKPKKVKKTEKQVIIAGAKVYRPLPTIIAERVEKRIITTMRMPADLLSRLNIIAIKERRSRSSLIEKVLNDYVAQQGEEKSVFG